MRYWRIAVLVLVLNCRLALASDAPEGKPQDVEYCQLTKNPTSFLGKRIRLRAFYVNDSEIRLLEPPVCCSEMAPRVLFGPTEWDDYSEKLWRKKLDKGMGVALVVLIGKFENLDPEFSERIGVKSQVRVERIEKVEHYAKWKHKWSSSPAWVPQKCKSTSWSLIEDFTESPTEHIINEIKDPFVVQSVEGKITLGGADRETPLADTLFEIQGPGADRKIRYATTGPSGRFRIGNVSHGTYKFKATLNGFQSVVGSITVSKEASKTQEIKISMRVGV